MPSSILNLKFKGNKSFVAFSNLGDSDSLTKTWKVCTKVASYLEQGQRLENLSWRLWHLQNLIVDTDNAKSKREFKKLSKVMGDKLDKEKGRAIEELEAPDFKLNLAAEKLRLRAEEKERSRIESATHASGRPLKRMQFTFAVDQPAGSFSEAPGPLSGVRKPDLKPSSQFRDTVHRRRPATRASAAQADNEKAHANDPQDKEREQDLPSLTQLGRKPSPTPNFSSDASSYMNWSTSHNSSSDDSSYAAAALRFPTLFNNDFGPSALLFPQPSLVTPLSYGEDAASVRDREAFQIPRPTIELPLDEILRDMARSEQQHEREPESPGAWSSSLSNGGSADVEMKSTPLVRNRRQSQTRTLPSTVRPSQVQSSTSIINTPTPSVSRSKPSLTVRTSSSRSSGAPSASITSTGAGGVADGVGSTAPGGVKAECSNCGATHTPLWRRGLNDELNCNACGLYCKLHKRPRPKSMRSQHGEGRHSSTPRSDNTDAMGEPAQCYNCHTTATPLWRKDDEGKTVCNACGLYFKLHGASRPISMKSDVIRKRSRHDARRVDPGETPSASPGASRRASPSSGASAERESPTLAPDSSTAQPAYSFSPEDYDFAAPSVSAGANATEFGSNNMGMSGNMFSSSGPFDPSGMLFTQTFPGPYHPDYLCQRSFAFGDDVNGYANTNGRGGQDEEDRMSKRRRMSVDSVSEPPSSTTSYSSYATEATSATTASQTSLDYGLSLDQRGSGGAYGYSSYNGGSSGTLRAGEDAFWHPPMLPQSADKSPGCFVHPPMLPSSDEHSSPSFGTSNNGIKGFPMDFLHPPMMPGNGSGNSGSSSGGGREEDRDLFSSYLHLHPPMVLNGEDSPMSSMNALNPHPPMLPPGEFYSSHHGQEQQQGYAQHQQSQRHEQGQGHEYHHQSRSEQQQQQRQEQSSRSSYHRRQQQQEHQEHQQRFFEQFGSVH